LAAVTFFSLSLSLSLPTLLVPDRRKVQKTDLIHFKIPSSKPTDARLNQLALFLSPLYISYNFIPIPTALIIRDLFEKKAKRSLFFFL
jgi:hypothetical protein